MTNRDIYETALTLLAEDLDDEDGCEDYEARAPYILSMLFAECDEDNRYYRAANGISSEAVEPSEDLDDDFPLEDRFAPAAAYYLAAMLLETESMELSDRYFAKYAEAMTRIRDGLPATVENIRNVYD